MNVFQNAAELPFLSRHKSFFRLIFSPDKMSDYFIYLYFIEEIFDSLFPMFFHH